MASAEQYGNQGLWRARYKKPDGKMGSQPGFRTEKLARNWGIAEEAKITANPYGWVDPKKAKEPFGKWVKTWWAAQDLAVNSMDGYERVIRTMIVPHFGTWEIGAIRPIHIEAWKKKLRKGGYKPSSITTAHSRLHTIFVDAIDNGLISSNPAVTRRRRGKEQDKPKEDEHSKLWISGLNALLLAERCAILGGRDEDFVFVIMIAYTGMRLGEAIGLEKRFARAKLHGLIRVDTQLVEVKGVFYRHPPKKGSARDILLPPFLSPLIVDQVAATDDNFCRCQEVHAVGRPQEYVYLGPQHGHHHRTNYYRRQFTPAAEGRRPLRRGERAPVYVMLEGEPWPGKVTGARGAESRAHACWLPIPVENPEDKEEGDTVTPHSLRHSHKSWMIEDGIPEVAQFERLGHELGGIRGVYSHVSDQLRQDILDGMQARWEASLRARFAMCPRSPVPLLDGLLEPLRNPVSGKDLHYLPTAREKPSSRIAREGL